MYVGKSFDPADPGEVQPFTFDFVRDLPDGETITGATWTCSVAEDSEVADASAAARLVGAATVSGTKTTQRVGGLIAGVKYVLLAEVATSGSNELSLWAHVECRLPQ